MSASLAPWPLCMGWMTARTERSGASGTKSASKQVTPPARRFKLVIILIALKNLHTVCSLFVLRECVSHAPETLLCAGYAEFCPNLQSVSRVLRQSKSDVRLYYGADASRTPRGLIVSLCRRWQQDGKKSCKHVPQELMLWCYAVQVTWLHFRSQPPS